MSTTSFDRTSFQCVASHTRSLKEALSIFGLPTDHSVPQTSSPRVQSPDELKPYASVQNPSHISGHLTAEQVAEPHLAPLCNAGFSASLTKAMDGIDFHLTADDLSNPGGAMRSAWHTVPGRALSNGVELTLKNGVVQARDRFNIPHRKIYPGDWQSWTLAETIAFVYGKGGCVAFAMKMWKNEMVALK